MGDSLTLLDMFLRGLGIGALAVLGISAMHPGVGRDQRIAVVLSSVSTACWLITESPTLWAVFGRLHILSALAIPVAAFFWLFVLTTLEDRRVTPLMLAPAAVQEALGLANAYLPPQAGDAGWWGVNSIAALLALHACWVIARGWKGDLMESRRLLRGFLLAVAAAFAVVDVAFAFTARIGTTAPWRLVSAGRPYGGGFISLVIVVTTAMFVQMRSAVRGPPRAVELAPDPRIEAAERLLVEKLNAVMAAEAWRREGLSIGDLADELQTPEHRLRRLINQRLGYRNFADFLNAHRIEAAKRRLADPETARTTVAAIAFDLGYGSLGPFNRAFRAATGATPTEWRRRALAEASPEVEEAL